MENAKNKNFEYKNVKSKSGEFTAHINKDINKKLDDYCFAKCINKTTYVCEVEFPNNITIDMLKRNIDSFVSVATINPIHAFTNAYLVESNGNIRDYGLSLLDLTLPTASFHILNFSNLDQNDKLNKFIIYENK